GDVDQGAGFGAYADQPGPGVRVNVVVGGVDPVVQHRRRQLRFGKRDVAAGQAGVDDAGQPQPGVGAVVRVWPVRAEAPLVDVTVACAAPDSGGDSGQSL